MSIERCCACKLAEGSTPKQDSMELTFGICLKTTPGKYSGLSGNLKQLVQQGPGVYFIVACRAIVGQPEYQQSQQKTIHYYPAFPSILGGQVRLQNEISQSLRKRRRVSPGISRTKKPKTVMNDLISRFSTALRL